MTDAQLHRLEVHIRYRRCFELFAVMASPVMEDWIDPPQLAAMRGELLDFGLPLPVNDGATDKMVEAWLSYEAWTREHGDPVVEAVIARLHEREPDEEGTGYDPFEMARNCPHC